MLFCEKKLNVMIASRNNRKPLVVVVDISVVSLDVDNSGVIIECCLQDNSAGN